MALKSGQSNTEIARTAIRTCRWITGKSRGSLPEPSELMPTRRFKFGSCTPWKGV